MIDENEEELKQEIKIPVNAVLLYEGNEAPESWSKLDLDSGIDGYIYIKKNE